MKDYRLIIFDKDGTLCRSKTGRTFINSIEDQELIPGVLEKIQELKAQGRKVAIASNQGGVAFGYISFREAWYICRHVANLVDADYYTFCPYHPNGTVKQFALDVPTRKPGPGMIFEIIGRLNVDNEAEAILFVGDRPEDEQAAKNAGVDFHWAWQWFNWPEPKAKEGE